MNLGAGAETGIYQVKDGEIDEYGNYIMENGDSNGGWNLQ